jgi:hypothetical protein
MESWATLELLLAVVVLLFVVMVLLLMECSKEEMIEGEAMALVDATLTHMSELLVVMVMSLMTMMVFHTVVLLHMVMMVVVMTVEIEMVERTLQESSCKFPNSLERKTRMHILIGKSNVIRYPQSH